MEWTREGQILAPGGTGEPDSLRALRPWVIEEDDGTLRMWYSGHDGTTSRILEAVREASGGWKRLGIAVDVGLAGETDGYGVESPCVVKIRGRYLMVYTGFDGEVTRLHMATSADGNEWAPQGTFMQREAEDALGAAHPCLLISGERWWLFFSAYDGSENGRRATIVAAISQTGASWDRVGTVLAPARGELAVSHPCVLETSKTLYMFYASDDAQRTSIAMATSVDGVAWAHRGTTLAPLGDGPEGLSVHTPCVVRLKNGSLRIWYSALSPDDAQLGYRIRLARIHGPWTR